MKKSKKIVIVISIFLFILMLGMIVFAKNNIKKDVKKNTKNASALTNEKVSNSADGLNKLAEEKLTMRQVEKERKLEEANKLAEIQKEKNIKKADDAKKVSTKVVASNTVVPKPIVSTNNNDKLLVEKIKGVGNAEQVIIVTSDTYKTIHSNINCFEKQNGKWRQVYSVSGVIGINGFSSNRHEGDLTTPVGIYSLGTAFGKYSNPGTSMTYRQTTTNDIWADDPQYYNTWVTNPSISGESMLRNDCLYDYGFVINFNIPSRTIGKGSGIFFHVWRSSNNGTAGCIATSENNAISILKWLNPSKNPKIIEGPIAEVLKM